MKGQSTAVPILLTETPIYASATAKAAVARVKGKFYIYDGKEIHGRYRITSSVECVGKRPISANIKGYVNKFDVR